MTTSIDSNIVVALWFKSHSANSIAAQLLGEAQKRGKLVISAPVYAELMADPARTENQLDQFAADTGISLSGRSKRILGAKRAGLIASMHAGATAAAAGNPDASSPISSSALTPWFAATPCSHSTGAITLLHFLN